MDKISHPALISGAKALLSILGIGAGAMIFLYATFETRASAEAANKRIEKIESRLETLQERIENKIDLIILQTKTKKRKDD